MKIYTYSSKRAGFTIVELLITIIVIATLATITMIAYRNIQARANAIATESTIEQYKKGLIAYVAANDQYPVDGTFCLGEVSIYPDGCWFGGSASNTAVSELKTIMSSLPPINSACKYMYGGDCRRNLTLFYQPDATLDGNPHPYYLVYFLSDNQSCQLSGNLGGTWENYSSTSNPSGFFERDTSTEVSMCIIAMPNPAIL